MWLEADLPVMEQGKNPVLPRPLTQRAGQLDKWKQVRIYTTTHIIKIVTLGIHDWEPDLSIAFFPPWLTLIFLLLLPVDYVQLPFEMLHVCRLILKGEVWPNDSFQMAAQYFTDCFSLIAFLPSDWAQPLLASLAYLTHIDCVEFSGTGGGPFIYLFLYVLSIFVFPFQAFILNSSQMLSVHSLDLLSNYMSACRFFLFYLLSTAKFKQC